MVCLLETCQLFDTRFLVEMRSRIAQRARYPVLHVSPGPAFDIWLMLMRATAASNAARTRASSKLASAAICAFRIASPTADGAICHAARGIFRAVARSRVIGIASPCLSALRLERALPAAVLGPRLRAPLRRLAAICLSVAIPLSPPSIEGVSSFKWLQPGRKPFELFHVASHGSSFSPRVRWNRGASSVAQANRSGNSPRLISSAI